MEKLKIFKSVCICLLIVVFFSCDMKKEYYAVDTLKTIDKLYVGDSIKGDYSSFTLIEPQEAISVDSMMVVLTNQKSGFINIISCASDTAIASFGEFGHAVNEFTSFPHDIYSKVDQKTGEHLLYIPDNDDRITRIINVEKSISRGVCCVDSTFKNNISSKGGEKTVVKIDEGHFFYCYGISYDDPRDNLFIPPVWCDLNGASKWEYHPHPEIISASSPNMMFAAYTTKNQLSPDMRNFVSAMKFIDYVSLCNLETRKVIGITTNRTYGFEQFELLKTERDVAEKLLWYNIDVSTTNELVLVLKTHSFYGELEKMEKTGIYNYPTFLHIYNWQGDLIKEFQVESGIRTICYNETIGVLYCFKNTGEIVKYNIPKIIE